MPELSLVLPVVNEADIIKAVVSEIELLLSKEKINYELVLVENESDDNSLTVLKSLEKNNQRLRVVETSRGYGSAVLAGLEKAKGTFVGYMPSDGQIDPVVLAKMFAIAKSDKYDVVKVKRTTRENIVRYLRSRIFNFLAQSLFQIDVWDINGSPRIFKRKKLSILELSFKDSFIDTEFAIKSHFLNWKINEMEILNRDRVGGISTVRLKTVIEFIKNLFEYRFSPKLTEWKKRNI